MIEQRFTSEDWPPPPDDATLVDLLCRRATQAAERTIYTLLDDEFFDSGIVSGPSLTYGALDRRARSIALRLGKLGNPGDRILLLFAPGLEFMPAFFGCLYAGMIPVPAYPPMVGMQLDPLASVRRIAVDCAPMVWMTGGAIANELQTLMRKEPLFSSIHSLNTDEIGVDRTDQWQRPSLEPNTIALLQYTSGSTGSPRGVVVSHDNILKNEYVIQTAFNHMTHLRKGVGVCWLPFHHDMGLMGNVVQSVFVDGPCYFLSPMQFLRKPVRWLQAITHLAPLTPYSSGGPNFAYELCVRKVTDEQKASLDLSCWELACIGAEAVSAATLDRFTKAFAPCGFDPAAFYPSYGLAEATLFVTGGSYFKPPVRQKFIEHQGRMTLTDSNERGRELVGNGHAWHQHEVLIVDPTTAEECEAGRVGEIWLRGPSVGQGYWNRPEESRQTFEAYLLPSNQGPYLRTGDLGFFHNSELFITGRLKDLIIIRGRNYFPEDIEFTVRQLHPAFRGGSTVALGHPIDDEERLVILQEIDRGNLRLDTQRLMASIRQSISEEHQLQTYDIRLLRRSSLPKTTSGKVQRFACREMYATGQLLEWLGPANK